MSNEEFIDPSFIDGEPIPDIDEKPDGRVTVIGEEIPEDVTQVDEKVVDDTTPKTEEPERVTSEPEVQKELSPAEIRFRELKLEKQFPGGIIELIERQPKSNKYITDLESERNHYRELANREPEATEQDPTRDDFFDDPIGITSKVMDSKLSEINKKLDSMEVSTFISSKQDYEQLEPAMIQQLEEHPYIRTLGLKAIPVLYQMAKAIQLSQAQSTTPVQPQPEAKANAETSAGKKTPAVNKGEPSYWQSKSLKEMEQELGYSEP